MIRGETTQLPLYEFVVTYADSPSSTTASIRACYMQEEGRFVVFKDRGHGVVFAVNADALVAVRRESLTEREVQE